MPPGSTPIGIGIGIGDRRLLQNGALRVANPTTNRYQRYKSGTSTGPVITIAVLCGNRRPRGRGTRLRLAEDGHPWAHGVRRWGPRNRNVASRSESNPSMTMSTRPKPMPNPPCGGQP